MRPPITRRASLAIGLAAPFLPRFARAAEFAWRLGHTAPPAFPLHKRLLEAAAAIKTNSNGRVDIVVHPNSDLGSQIGLLAQVRAGTLEATPLTSQIMAADLSTAALPTVGFAFPDTAHLWTAMDGPVGAHLRGRITERLGLVPMQKIWDFGFRQVSTVSKVIQTPADIVGLRLRTPGEPDFITLFQALQARPLAMPLTSMPTALITGSLDGQDSLLGLIPTTQLEHVLTACAITNHIWDGQWLCISRKAWTQLPPPMQEIVATAFNDAAQKQRDDTAADYQKDYKTMEAAGVRFSAVDIAAFRATLRATGYYAAWRKKMGDDAWTILEQQTGPLA